MLAVLLKGRRDTRGGVGGKERRELYSAVSVYSKYGHSP